MTRISRAASLLVFAAAFLLVARANAQDGEPAWADSARLLAPPGTEPGLAYPNAPGTRTGYLALYPAGANDPASPGSAFKPGALLQVEIVTQGGRIGARNPMLLPRKGMDLRRPGDAGFVDEEYAAWDKELLAKASTLPPGTEPCDISGWSEDRDPSGLNVRAEPSLQAPILGTLPPPYDLDGENWLTEFSIVGWKDGWFLIEGAEPPGLSYSDPDAYPKDHPVPYEGRGWVAASRVSGSFANGGLPPGFLYQAPHSDARRLPAKAEHGDIETGAFPKRLLACSGSWALVESHDGVIGWWRGFCSNQVTNCS